MTITRKFSLFFMILFCLTLSLTAQAAPRSGPVKEKINAIVVGDRLATIVDHLGIVPEALVARCVWPAVTTGELRQIERLGCPKRVTVKDKKRVAEFVEKNGIKRILIENSKEFCLYMPKVNPMNIIPLLEGKGLTLDVVDFENGLDAAIRATGKLLNREAKAEELIKSYASSLARAKKKMPKEALGKKILILNGIMVGKTGKSFIQVEASGGYSDRYFLDSMGCVNVGNLLKPEGEKISKGYFTLKKMTNLLKADPDIIIVTGKSFPVERAIAKAVKKDRMLAQVSALKNHEIYNLPVYVGGSVLDYPYLLTLWSKALYR